MQGKEQLQSQTEEAEARAQQHLRWLYYTPSWFCDNCGKRRGVQAYETAGGGRYYLCFLCHQRKEP